MQAILYGQMKVLSEAKEPVLFTGADCLLTHDPRSIFEDDFDLGITTSDTFLDCKMNTGAIFVKHPRLCFDTWAKAYLMMPKEWGEDQVYLYKSIRESNLKIKEFSCEDHNWAPKSLDDDANLSTIVHFRGKRKSFMKSWANKYLGIN
jgi:hypothetical protein